ncbi:MAG: hypothetical protein LBP92_01720 [Deltaproteobacteria bacterium]|jgi:hypothetical protein|nr:hypothetical protein [Deltaproteobacteria bacterium]MDR1309865.1 hypothetical protein [Deltaproteobacteria bacterium]
MFKAKHLKEIQAFMEKKGLPGRDAHALPDSPLAFADGAHYRIEIAGIERLSNFRAMLDEARKLDLPVHRAICTVGGSTYMPFGEMRELARLARDSQVELVMVVGHRKSWDVGARELGFPEGVPQGPRHRGSDNVTYWIEDMMRCLEAGMRGFLVYDEGLLRLLGQMRAEGFVPPETFFKWSVFGGQSSPVGAKLLEDLGANTMNPISDVSLAILGSIRAAVRMPLDVYMIIVDAFGGMYRAYEAPEIARVAAPVYFKIEPGTSEADIYKPWIKEQAHDDLIRAKVQIGAILREIVQRRSPGLILSAPGPKDLTLPAAD